ncbi:fibronectin type III domain-containing protein [Streptomyces sp. NBC_00102]|uniref:fibronectin type III domain-containing protein n=1 Tax=Streptomyces sp. NBC_00102 TaxID=2975652 RepID=UPI0022599AEC|nr:fibronectin type III domain-containing protein [Streptomyces sp. NBC_00102]MCX5400662.1 fibronectin type III domain-containing protein [Streptomyces sp. NBC_00102]
MKGGSAVQRPPTRVVSTCSAVLLLSLLTGCGGSARAADTQAPTTPQGVTAQSSSATSAHVMWEPSTDDEAVTGYEIYRGATRVKAVPAAKHMIDVDGLTASTDYTFTVRARDAAGNLSAAGPGVSVTTQPTPPDDREAPTEPGGLRATAVGTDSATLSWKPATDDVGVSSYDVYQEDSRIHSVSGTVTSARLTGLRPGTVYTFTVRARDASDKSSADSRSVDITTESVPGAPASTAPTGLRTETKGKPGDYVVTLTWDQPEVGGAIPAYELHLDGKPTTTIVWGGTPPKGRATYELTLTEPKGTRHSVKVRAKLPDGTWGDFSAQRTLVLGG